MAGPERGIMSISVNILLYDELSGEDQKRVPNNGVGREAAQYMEVHHNGGRIALASSAMEVEDATFTRDLSWMPGLLEHIYGLGVVDGAVQGPI